MEKMTLEQFGEVLKKKYPEYASRDSNELATRYLDKNPVYKSKVALPVAPQPERPDLDKGFGERVKDRYVERGQQLNDIFMKRGTEMQQAATPLEEAKIGGTALAETIGRGASLVSDVTGEALKSAFRSLPGDRSSGVEGALRSGGRAVMQSKPGQSAVQALAGGMKKAEEFEEKHPVLGAAGRTGLAVADLVGLGKLTQGGVHLTKRLATSADDLARSTGNKVVGAADDIYRKAAGKVDDFKIAEKVLGKPKTPAELAGIVVQGEKGDKLKALGALREVDLSDVKTYADLSGKLDDQIKLVTGKVDDALMVDNTPLSVDDLTHAVKVGGKTVETNYVQKALDNLDELYRKTEDAVSFERINQLREKMNTTGLTRQEVNNIAREYGRVQSGFNFSGTPSTSVTKQGYENIRKGIKETVRGKMPDELTRTLDLRASNLIKTRELVDDVVEKVNALAQKVSNPTVIEKLSKKAVDVFNTVTGGGPRQILFSLTGLRNQGFKTLNALDLEKQLPKILKQLDELLKAPVDNALINKIDNLFSGAAPSAKAAFTAKPKPLLPPVANKGAILPLLRPRGEQD